MSTKSFNFHHMRYLLIFRLSDHLESCDTFSLKKLRYFVLDEADRMLDGSFEQQVSLIERSKKNKSDSFMFLFLAFCDIQGFTTKTPNFAFFGYNFRINEEHSRTCN